MNVDLDHAWVGSDLNDLDTRIVRRRIALDMNLKLHVFCGCLHHRDQFEIVLELLHRRHERAENAVANLDRQRRADTALSASLLLLNELARPAICQCSTIEYGRLSDRLG